MFIVIRNGRVVWLFRAFPASANAWFEWKRWCNVMVSCVDGLMSSLLECDMLIWVIGGLHSQSAKNGDSLAMVSAIHMISVSSQGSLKRIFHDWAVENALLLALELKCDLSHIGVTHCNSDVDYVTSKLASKLKISRL